MSNQFAGQQLSGQGAVIPVIGNEAYEASCSFATRANPVPPPSSLPPAPPPPLYPGNMEVRAKVKSIHEYDYIKNH